MVQECVVVDDGGLAMTTPMPWSMKQRRPIWAPGWGSIPVTAPVAVASTRAGVRNTPPARHIACAARCNHTACRPGAAGANDVRLGLSGPDEEVEQLREAAAGGDATVSFRSLALGSTSPESPLTLDDEGALVASDVVLDGDGRWRAQFEVGLDEPIVADMTMQSNPGHDS